MAGDVSGNYHIYLQPYVNHNRERTIRNYSSQMPKTPIHLPTLIKDKGKRCPMVDGNIGSIVEEP